MTEASLLRQRLAAFRRRVRLAALVRGICWPVALFLGMAIAAGMLDWRLHLQGIDLPSPARAVLLAGALTAFGCLLRWLWLPRTDDLALALRIESVYPSLNDALTSAMQFLQQDGWPAAGGLRRAAVEQAWQAVQTCDLRRAARVRGVILAAVCMLMGAAGAGLLAQQQPVVAGAALARLADPYGGHAWPKQTRLVLDPVRAPVARGSACDIRASVWGTVPEEATVEGEGASPARQAWPIRQGRLVARLERVEQDFRFRVRANDAVTDWQAVPVRTPPGLALHDGRASPRIRLQFPAYTGLAVAELPDGAGDMDAIAGTAVHLEATADRPLARAWVDFRPAVPALAPAIWLGSLGATDSVGEAALAVAAGEVAGMVPARLDSEGRSLYVDFVPRASGRYVLHLEDAQGLASGRSWEVRLRADPAPVIRLELPQGASGLEMLPRAEIELRVRAEDPEYGLRSVGLEYRCGNDGPARPLGGPRRLAWPGPRHLDGTWHVEIGRLRHGDGRPVRGGDVLFFRAWGMDFDDISVRKPPGRSPELELRVVDRPGLAAALDRAELAVRQELARLEPVQQQALAEVRTVQRHQQESDGGGAQDLDRLRRAEQLQRQVREGVANRLAPELSGALAAARHSGLSAAEAGRRLESVAASVARLAREILTPVESRLTNARKAFELARDQRVARGTEAENVAEASRLQEQAADELERLAVMLDPWSAVEEARQEVEQMAAQQQRLSAPPFDESSEPAGEASRRQAPPQARLAEEAAEWLERMQRLAEGRRSVSPETAAALQEAASKAQADDLIGRMRNAAADLGRGRAADAAPKQQQALDTLVRIEHGLRDRRLADQERRARELRGAGEKLSSLARRQVELARNRRPAPPAQTLARRQQDLQREAEAIRRELDRLRADRAAQQVAGASADMDEAVRRLARAADAGQAQAEALQRLGDARQQLDRARQTAKGRQPQAARASGADRGTQPTLGPGPGRPIRTPRHTDPAGTGGTEGVPTAGLRLPKDVWGHLPETARLEAEQYARDQFMTRYGDLLRQYYATVAEKGRKK